MSAAPAVASTPNGVPLLLCYVALASGVGTTVKTSFDTPGPTAATHSDRLK